jgi:hypothetical protein
MSQRAAYQPVASGGKWKLILGLFIGLLGVLIVAAIVVAGLLYNSLTVVRSPESYGSCAFLDAKSGADKLRLLEKDKKANASGFVGLNEAEINSLIQWVFLGGKAKPLSAFADPPEALRQWTANSKPKTASDCQLAAARVKLGPEGQPTIEWHCWINKTWRGRTRMVQWDRQVRLSHTPAGWSFITESMRVGDRVIPPQYWETVRRQLGNADQDLQVLYQWYQKMPAVAHRLNKNTQLPEVVFYNYEEPAALNAAK